MKTKASSASSANSGEQREAERKARERRAQKTTERASQRKQKTEKQSLKTLKHRTPFSNSMSTVYCAISNELPYFCCKAQTKRCPRLRNCFSTLCKLTTSCLALLVTWCLANKTSAITQYRCCKIAACHGYISPRRHLQ